MLKPNQDIRDYMADHGVSQRMLAASMNTYVSAVNRKLQSDLTQKEKEEILNHIDSIAADKTGSNDIAFNESVVESVCEEEQATECETSDDVSVSTKFRIGDRVKIPSKSMSIGIISDIWHSLHQNKVMYAVDTESGTVALYAENQLEPAPLPIEYTFEAHIDGNVAVSTMIAHQGEKTWIYARGHAHIIHDGEVGMAQAVSYASRRMFETLDKQQDKKIYFKDGGINR